jgi:hypothetical protein
MKAQTDEYAEEFSQAETPAQMGVDSFTNEKVEKDPKDESSLEECYDLQYPEDEKAQDLKDAIVNSTDYLIVTVWFENYQNRWGQNLFNQDVRGTIWKLICKYHPHAIYTEVDLSQYNQDQKDYKKLAAELRLDLTDLYKGPSVTVMYQEWGEGFRSEKGPRDLSVIVDNYISLKEKELFDAKIPYYDVQNEVLAKNKYDYYMPNKSEFLVKIIFMKDFEDFTNFLAFRGPDLQCQC